MPDPDPAQTSVTLSRAARGDTAAEKQITTMMYQRLRELAGHYFRGERPDNTLQPTALVHEAYVRLLGQSRVDWRDRSFFLGVAAREMRRALIDHARAHHRKKRAGDWKRVLLDQVVVPVENRDIELLEIEEALEELSALDERQGRMVELRFYGGLTVEEVARVLGISPKTVEKDWRLARAWLHRYFTRGDER